MKEPNGGSGGDGGGPSTSAQNQEYELLGYIQVTSFTASPAQSQPFQPVTLSWQVQLPTALHVPVKVGVANQLSYQTSGSAVVTPDATTEYTLLAETAIVSRVIPPPLTVTVDDSGCVSGPGYQIDSFAITSLIKQTAEQYFQGSSQFSLGSAGVSVTINDAIISISVPLILNVPDWFNADMSLAIGVQIGLQGAPPNMSLLVQLSNVTVNVSWSWYANLLSADITGAVADGMQQVAQAFLTEIAQTQVVPQIAGQIEPQIQASATAAQQNDPAHRTFVLTSLSFDTNALAWTLCPLLAAVPPTRLPPGQTVPPLPRMQAD